LNEKFFELPEEKRQKIVNAGFEVFGLNDYKRASTEEIAVKAGISKGLLFYYFQNKRALYTFLFDLAANRMKDYVVDGRLFEITDFFEFCEYAAERKCRMLRQSPYIMDFILRAFYSQNEAVSEDINRKVRDQAAAVYSTYFQGIDTSKFRDDVRMGDIYQMLAWMTDGYIRELQRTGRSVELNDVMDHFKLWSAYLKRVSYKEEYLK